MKGCRSLGLRGRKGVHNVDGHDWRFAWVDELSLLCTTLKRGVFDDSDGDGQGSDQMMAFDLFSIAFSVGVYFFFLQWHAALQNTKTRVILIYKH